MGGASGDASAQPVKLRHTLVVQHDQFAALLDDGLPYRGALIPGDQLTA